MIKRLFGHLRVVMHHKNLVFKYCIKAGIPWRGLVHDLSKFSPAEFWPSVRYFSDGRRSPTVAERIDRGYSAVWLHHKGRNKHHFEYWTEFNWNKNFIFCSPMPIRYLKEMFCDRLAATKTYLRERYTDLAPLEYFIAKDDRPYMHPQTADILLRALMTLAVDGEKAAFKYLRGLKK